GRLTPADNVVVISKTLSASKVCLSMCFVQATDQFDTARLEQEDVREIGNQAIGQENISTKYYVPKSPEQTDFALSFAGVAAESQIEDRPTPQRRNRPDACDRETKARLLIVDLRIGLLVFWRVRHGNRSPVEQVDASPFPQPALLGSSVQSATDGTSHLAE